MKKKKVKTKPVIELRQIGMLNARLIQDGKQSFVELYVRLESAPVTPPMKITFPHLRAMTAKEKAAWKKKKAKRK